MIDAISSRRTCRKFDPTKSIPKETIQVIANAGISAPTGCNCQSYDLVVCTNQDTLSQIAVHSAEALKGLYSAEFTPEKIFYGAPVVIFVVPARKEYPPCVNYDQGIIADSICLAATTHRIASAIIGATQLISPHVFKEALHLPTETAALGVALGYAAADWAPAPREFTSPVKWID
jgi:nitroreductase